MRVIVEWVKRTPNPDNGDADVEIRPLVEAEEFGPEAAARDERLRGELARDE